MYMLCNILSLVYLCMPKNEANINNISFTCTKKTTIIAFKNILVSSIKNSYSD